MHETQHTTSQVLETYYELLGATAAFDPERLRTVLASDLDFEGPIAGRRVGADPFLKGVAGFVGTVTRIEMLHWVVDGGAAATLYDAEMPGGPVRIAEFFRVEGGAIRSLRLLFDPAAYRDRGGR